MATPALLKRWLRMVEQGANTLLNPHPAPRSCTRLETWAQESARPGRMVWGPEVGERLSRKPPRTEGATSARFAEALERQSPPLFVAELSGGRVFGRNGVVITPDNQVPTDVSFDYGVRDSHSLQRHGNLPRARRAPGRLAAVASTGTRGYFHFLFDVLPRFGLLQGVPVDRYYVDVRFPFQREYLRLLQVPEAKIEPAGRRTHLQPDSLIVPSLPGGSGNVTQRSRDFLRRLMPDSVSRTAVGEKIYISRGDARYRRVLNEDEVVRMLTGRGFRVVTLQGRSVVEQMGIFAGARVVVAPHGAGLSNLVYCDPGTRVVEMFSPDYVNVCYWALSEICSLDYRYLVGGPPATASGRKERGDMLIDLRLLERSLAMAESAGTDGRASTREAA